MLTNDANDAELAIRAASGEEVAFTALMRRHKDRLYLLIRRHIGDADEAYDLLQESFVSAWGALSRYDPERPFYTWLARIAVNKCRDHARRRFVRRLIWGSVPLEQAHIVIDSGATPETTAFDREALIQLDQAIAALPAKLKEPLILTAIDGMSQTEAARLLGVSTKAIETRVYRARLKLAETIASA